MASNEPTFTDDWMQGIPDKKYVRPIIEARKEFGGMSDSQVRELATRLDAAIKAWKLDQGAPIHEVLSGAVVLNRGPVPPYRKSDLEIVQKTESHPLFGGIPYRQRIALLIFKAVEKRYSGAVMAIRYALADLVEQQAKLDRPEESLSLGLKHADHVASKRMKDLNKHRHKEDHAARECARGAFATLLADEQNDGRIRKQDEIIASIQDELNRAGHSAYSQPVVWRWVKDLDTVCWTSRRSAGKTE